MKKISTIAPILALLLLSPESQAVVVVVNFTATVTFVQNSPVAGIVATVGDIASGTFSYDTDSIDNLPASLTVGSYYGAPSTIDISGHHLEGSVNSTIYVHNLSSNDLFVVANGQPQEAGPLFIDGVQNNNVYTSFNFSGPASVLSSDSLPSVSELSAMSISQFNIVDQSTNGVILFDNVTSFSAMAVPEHSSIAIICIAACCGTLFRRRTS